MAPTAMMLPWPAMSRGTDATVPSPPGLVSDMVAPAKSSGISLLVRAFSTRLLVGRVKGGKVHRVGPLDDRDHQAAAPVLPLHVHGQAERDPSGCTRWGTPSRMTSVWPMTGICLVAWTSA